MAAAGSDRGARRVSYCITPEALAHGRAPPVAKKQAPAGDHSSQGLKFANDVGQQVTQEASTGNTLSLRPYQSESLAKVLTAWEDYDRLLGVAPTGSGKTVLFSHVIDHRLDSGRCLVLGHRDEILGKTRMLVNAMLLTEGYDEPSIDCIVPLRPTKIRSLYAQQVGRGARLHPGKDHLLLLDFLWLVSQHDLIGPATLISQTDAEAQRIGQAVAAGCSDLAEAREKAERDYGALLAEQLARAARRKARTMDLVEFALSLGSPQLTDYEPVMPWESDPISDKQREMLLKSGLDVEGICCKGHASAIIEKIVLRSKLSLATPKQVSLLTRLHYPNAHRATFLEASQFLAKRFATLSPFTSREGGAR
jgi:hypothetical protein